MPTTPLKEKIDVLIVTAAKGEDVAVKKVFGNDWITMNPTSQLDFFWDKIMLTSKQGRRFIVGLVRSKMRADNAGPIATIMLQYLRPSFVTMCGICAGHPDDTKLGNVIIADKVFRYDSTSVIRMKDGTVEERWDPAIYDIPESWWQLAERLEVQGINIHVGPIATGEALQRDSTVWDKIRNRDRKSIGLDMEASVIGNIARIVEKRWVVIKGVSDYATHKKDDKHHVLAKENAAKVLKEFLEIVADQLPKINAIDGVWVPPSVVDGQTVNLKNIVPSTLLHAKNEIVPFSDATRRQEFEALHELCRSDYASRGIIQLFAGPGGSGKTRLMIEWTRRLKETDSTWQTCFLTQGIDPNSQDFKDIFLQDNHLFL